jgi:hypothetical protein
LPFRSGDDSGICIRDLYPAVVPATLDVMPPRRRKALHSACRPRFEVATLEITDTGHDEVELLARQCPVRSAGPPRAVKFGPASIS